MLQEQTPTEQYQVNGHNVYVKRDDLFLAHLQPLGLPPLAKLRGTQVLLKRLKQEGAKRIGVYDTTVSKAGQGVAYLCRELGLECWLGFPLLKGTQPAESKLIAEQLGARLFPMKAGRTAVCYSQFKAVVEKNGGLMLPLGLVCRDTVLAVARVADETWRQLEKEGIRIKTIVVCTGTGTIATGIHLGASTKVIGVSCGMSVDRQWKRMRELAFPEQLNSDFLQLVPPEYDYYTALDTSKCPFPTSPYYDMKAFSWMQGNMEKLEHPTLFWNIGV